MSYKLKIAGVDRTAYVKTGNVRLADTLDARTTLTFTLVVPDASATAVRPVRGNTVFFEEAGASSFGGQIDRVTETLYRGADMHIFNCSCTDFTQICGRRLVYAMYSGQYDKEIITDLNTTWLSGEGITLTNCASGIVIPLITFEYKTVTEAINEICHRTGASWYIDPDKDLHYFFRTENPAPIEITDSSNNFKSFSHTGTRDKYRNREWLRINDCTTTLTENFYGDAQMRTFTVQYPIFQEPTVTIDASASTVGIRGVDLSGTYDWYWQKGSTEISQDFAATTLTSLMRIRIEYIGYYPAVVLTDEVEEITDRIAAEGGAGIYDLVESDKSIYKSAEGLVKADSILGRYGFLPNTATIETEETGLLAGQLIKIELPQFGIDEYYYITSVTGAEIDGKRILRRVTAISGQDRGGWVSFFKSLQKRDDIPDLSQQYLNDVFIYQKKFGGQINVTELLVVTETIYTACLVGTGLVGACQVI